MTLDAGAHRRRRDGRGRLGSPAHAAGHLRGRRLRPGRRHRRGRVQRGDGACGPAGAGAADELEGAVRGWPAARPLWTVGETVDLDRLADSIAEALRDDEQQVRLPMRPIQPRVTREEADAFVTSVARPAAAQPVRLTARRGTVTLDPAALSQPCGRWPRRGPAARIRRRGRVPAEGGHEGALPGQPVGARVVLGKNGPRVVPGQEGFRISREAWAAGVLEGSTQATGQAHGDPGGRQRAPSTSPRRTRGPGTSGARLRPLRPFVPLHRPARSGGPGRTATGPVGHPAGRRVVLPATCQGRRSADGDEPGSHRDVQRSAADWSRRDSTISDAARRTFDSRARSTGAAAAE